MMETIDLLKHEVFAIRGEDWLYSICTFPEHLSFECLQIKWMNELYSQHLSVYKNLKWWDKLFTFPRDYNSFDRDAVVCEGFRNDFAQQQSEKDQIWKNIRNKYSLVEVIKAGSFSDHKIIIKDNNTNIQYQGYCNNYGGDNYFIKFTKI